MAYALMVMMKIVFIHLRNCSDCLVFSSLGRSPRHACVPTVIWLFVLSALPHGAMGWSAVFDCDLS